MMGKNKRWAALAAAGCIALLVAIAVVASYNAPTLRPPEFEPAFSSWLPPDLPVRRDEAGGWKVSYPLDAKKLPVAPLNEPHISFDFGYPVSMRALRLAAEPGAVYKAWITATDDGGARELVALGEATGAEVEFPLPQGLSGKRAARLLIAYKPGGPSLQPIATFPPAQIRPESGKSFSIPTPENAGEFDDLQFPTRSKLFLLEDGKRLGPPHAVHDEIRKTGGGRYSHWGGTIFFSSSDGSDPRSNGRKYVIARVKANEVKIQLAR